MGLISSISEPISQQPPFIEQLFPFLRPISATAVCPGWVETEMLPKTNKNVEIKYPGLVSPKRVALKVLSDAKKKKDMSVCTAYVKYMHLLSKLFPHKIVMNSWVRSVSKYLLYVFAMPMRVARHRKQLIDMIYLKSEIGVKTTKAELGRLDDVSVPLL